MGINIITLAFTCLRRFNQPPPSQQQQQQQQLCFTASAIILKAQLSLPAIVTGRLQFTVLCPFT